ncbi:hypothetical protein UG55_100119 [Frankia sp. EI5c]|uniref:hypothetical protein n=1 Tax=Frankia sp. EI5c TaxID=683316 RepID=UPI0007C28DB4|nr:hypothetical protein [Frankia sp. EI5c]OAA29514.1 hypothetical protein UG55_100119 [Frankia sp. EI5c]
MSLLAWAILVVLILGAVFGGVILADRSRSARLRNRFGPEYERTLRESGDRKSTERQLAGVARRRDSLEIRPLDPSRREALQAEWATLQALFVDEPVTATTRADELVTVSLRERGYPTDDRGETASLLAADNPALAAGYRGAGPVAAAGVSGTDPATDQATVTADTDTDRLRERFLALRAVFEELTSAAETSDSDSVTRQPTDSSPAATDSAATAATTDESTAREAAIIGRRQRR